MLSLILLIAGSIFTYFPQPVRMVAAQEAGICFPSAFTNGQAVIDKAALYYDEPFKSYVSVDAPPAVVQACAKANKYFRFYLSVDYMNGTFRDDYAMVLSRAFPKQDGSGYEANINSTLIKILATKYNSEDAARQALKDYEISGNQVRFIFRIWDPEAKEPKVIKDWFNFSALPNANPPQTHPVVNNIKEVSGSAGTDVAKLWLRNEIPLVIGMRNKFRAVYDQPLTIPYTMKWGSKIHPIVGTSLIEHKKGETTSNVLEKILLGINYGSPGDCDSKECLSERLNKSTDAHTALAEPDADSPTFGAATLPWDAINPCKTVAVGRSIRQQCEMDEAKKKYDEAVSADPQNPQKVNTTITDKGFAAFGIISGQAEDAYALPNGQIQFVVQVYATPAAREAACKADNPNNPDACKDEKGLSEAGEFIESTGTANAPPPASGCGTDIGCWLLDILSRVIGLILSLIAEVLYFIFYTLVVPILEAIMGIRTYSDTFAKVIYPGWQLIRNLGNIFFILALLITALATLFRFQGYQYKQILVDLVIAAVLVNFSLVFGQAVLAIAETAQNQFLPNNQIVIRSLGKQLMVQPLRDEGFLTADYAASQPTDTSAAFGKIVRQFILLILAFGAFMTFAAIAAYMIIRMVMLWILLMLSPVPYIARVLPVTKQYEEQWWTYFLKYAFFIPIMALFLNMTAVIANQSPRILRTIGAESFKGTSDLPSISGILFQIGSNIVLLVFLFAGFEVAKKFSIYGAETITNIAKKGTLAPLWAGKKLAGFGAEKFHEKTGIQINPKKWIEGWKESHEINKQRREERGRLKAEAKGSSLGEPVEWFQRYWGPKEVGRVLRGGQRRGRALLNKADSLNDEAKQLMEEGKALEDQGDDLGAKAKFDAARDKKKDALKKKMQGESLITPAMYILQRKAREAEHKELAMVKGDTWEELVDLFRSAEQQKNPVRMKAIAMKLADTFNENELVNHYQYKKDMVGADGKEHKAGEFFAQSGEGWADFQTQILQPVMGKEGANRFLDDISGIAEKKRHFGLMRMMDHKGGEYRQKTNAERQAEILAEKRKMGSTETLVNANRLGGFDEVPSLHYDLDDIRIPLIQENQRLLMAEDTQGLRFRINRGELNKSLAKEAVLPWNMRLMANQGKHFDNTNQTKRMRYDRDGKELGVKTDQEEYYEMLDQLQTYGMNQWRGQEKQIVKQKKVFQELLRENKLPDHYIEDLRAAGYIDANNNILIDNGDQYLQDNADVLSVGLQRPQRRSQTQQTGPKRAAGFAPSAPSGTTAATPPPTTP